MSGPVNGLIAREGSCYSRHNSLLLLGERFGLVFVGCPDEVHQFTVIVQLWSVGSGCRVEAQVLKYQLVVGSVRLGKKDGKLEPRTL
jgi:hypothetical protein